MAIDYSTQSPVTDPGPYADLLTGVPPDIANVSRTVQGLVYHYVTGKYLFGHEPPPERIREIDSRSAERILDRLLELDAGPLDRQRAYPDRVVGCCRDFSLLACSILRHHRVPARLRYGFATYFDEGYPGDHVIVEVWTGERWRRFDPQLAGVYDFKVDLFDMPAGAFLTGSDAWKACRSGADPSRFGLGPDVPEVSGLWFVRGRMQLDFAALQKRELLCWDSWGYGLETAELLEDDEHLLDRAAALSAREEDLLALIGNDARLSLPATVTCESPAVGPHDVELSPPDER